MLWEKVAQDAQVETKLIILLGPINSVLSDIVKFSVASSEASSGFLSNIAENSDTVSRLPIDSPAGMAVASTQTCHGWPAVPGTSIPT